jgi:hypothetical protein
MERMEFNNIVTPYSGHSGQAMYNQYYRNGANSFDTNEVGYVGNPNQGATVDVQSNMHCTRYTSRSFVAGTAYNVGGQFGDPGGSRSFKYVLYDNSGHLLAQSGVVTIASAQAPLDAGFTSYPTLAANTPYILCIFSNGGGTLPLMSGTGSPGDEIIDTTATWPTPNATLTRSSTGSHHYTLQVNTACDGTSPAETSPVDNPSTSNWPGNNSPTSTYRGYPCWHQPGRSALGTLSPMYGFNNYFSDNGSIINGGRNNGEVYSVNRSVCTDGVLNVGAAPCTPVYVSQHLQQEREWYSALDLKNQNGSQGTPTFDGTKGVGMGPLANRPSTCTPTTSTLAADSGKGGVGYWAVDQGSWNSGSMTYQIGGSGTSYSQGVLYTCDSTNHWSVNYTPYNYPHPLVSQMGFLAFTVQPVNVQSGSVMTSFTVSACLASGFPSCNVDTSKTDTITLTVIGCGSAESGTTSHALASGAYSFNAVTMTGSANSCTLQATATGYSSALSAAFNVR